MSQNLNKKQVERAVSSLLKYIKVEKDKATKQSLFDVADYLYLQVGLKKIPENKKINISIKLPNPIYQDDGFELCIFTKDAKKEYKEKFQKAGVNIKVIEVTKLRKIYKSYESRRKLLGSYDMFLADDRITSLLPRLLGKKFFENKKFPIPVKLKDADDLSEMIDDIKSKTHFSYKPGSSFTVKVGKADQESKEITANILAVAEVLSPKAIEDWNLIQSLYLKTSSSVALPIYLSNPLPLLGQPADNNENNNGDDDNNENENEDENNEDEEDDE